MPVPGDVLTQSGVAAVPEEDLEAVRVVAEDGVHQRRPPKLVPQIDVAEMTAGKLS